MNDLQYNSLDTLRAIATISVVFLHVSAHYLSKFGTIPVQDWFIANIIDGGTRFSVPIFFMISGALLLSKDYTLENFLKKRFYRILPPFLFWSVLYIIHKLWKLTNQGVAVDLIYALKFAGTQLLNGSMYHLWFVYVILGLYLFVPIIRKWIKVASQKEILFFLVIWVISMLFQYTFFKSYKPHIDLRYFSGYLGYMVLGYYLLKTKNNYLNKRFFAIGLIVIGHLITILGTYFLTVKTSSFNNTFYVYLTLNVFFSATGVFLFFKNFSVKNTFILRIIAFISKHSYGIYLIHILILVLMSNMGLNMKVAPPIINIPLSAIVCLLISSIIISLLKKSKVGRIIAG